MADCGCGCGCGPWIKLSACAVGEWSPTGELIKVRCPSIFCTGLVPLLNGRIAPHDGTVPGHCPWIGTRVIDDSAEFLPEDVTQTHKKPGA
ncbi:hypothetical protein GCM10023319_23470 [Nocardia iowensis]